MNGKATNSLYLRVAAVNFDATIFDTNDLSTVRGSGLALLEASGLVAGTLRRQFGDRVRIEELVRGASELVARIEPINEPPPTAGEIEAVVWDALAKRHSLGSDSDASEIDLSQFTFTVATANRTGSHERLLAELEARTRVQQYERLTVPCPPQPPEVDAAKVPCVLDRVRAASESDAGDRVSASVAGRRRFGRHKRKYFPREQLCAAGEVGEKLLERIDAGIDGAPIGLATQSLGDLCATPEEARRLGLKVGLQSKIALIHLDGNGFGALARNLFDKPKELACFSKGIVDLQRQFLAHVVGWFLDRSDHLLTPPAKGSDGCYRRLRLEILLWGGDEMTFAVPAWAAFDLVGAMIDHLDTWRLHVGTEEKALHHKIGVVFAHYKTPIRLLRSLADDVASSAATSDKRTNVQFLTVDSIDVPDGDITSLRRRLFMLPSSVESDRYFDFIPPSGSWRQTSDDLRFLSEVLPRAFVNGLVQELSGHLPAAHADTKTEERIKAKLQRITSVAAHRIKIQGDLFPPLRGRPIGPFGYSATTRLLPLLQVLDLLDYIAPLGPDCLPDAIGT